MTSDTRRLARFAAIVLGLFGTLALRAQQPAPPQVTFAGPAGRAEGRHEVADVFRHLRRPPSQPADADHARERASAHDAVDVSDRRARQLPGDADRDRRRDLHHRVQEQRLGDRCAIGPPDLAISARPAGSAAPLLRAGQSRLGGARRSPVHDHDRRAPARARHGDRRRAVRRDARGLQERLLGNGRAAGRQGQGHSRNRRRRVRHPRLHRGVRCRDGQEDLALQHGGRAG